MKTLLLFLACRPVWGAPTFRTPNGVPGNGDTVAGIADGVTINLNKGHLIVDTAAVMVLRGKVVCAPVVRAGSAHDGAYLGGARASWPARQ